MALFEQTWSYSRYVRHIRVSPTRKMCRISMKNTIGISSDWIDRLIKNINYIVTSWMLISNQSWYFIRKPLRTSIYISHEFLSIVILDMPAQWEHVWSSPAMILWYFHRRAIVCGHNITISYINLRTSCSQVEMSYCNNNSLAQLSGSGVCFGECI